MFFLFLIRIYSTKYKDKIELKVITDDDRETFFYSPQTHYVKEGSNHLVDYVLRDNSHFQNFYIFTSQRTNKYILLVNSLKASSSLFFHLITVKDETIFNERYLNNNRIQNLIVEITTTYVKILNIIKLLITFDNFLYNVVKKVFPVESVHNTEIIRLRDFVIKGNAYTYLDIYTMNRITFLDFLIGKEYHFNKISKFILKEESEKFKLMVDNSSSIIKLKNQLYDKFDLYKNLVKELFI